MTKKNIFIFALFFSLLLSLPACSKGEQNIKEQKDGQAKTIQENNQENKEEKDKAINQAREDELVKNTIEKADYMARGYYYDEALSLLKNLKLEREDIADKLREIEGLKNSLVLYEGDSYHVFFHSLIVDTHKAFHDDKGSPPLGYNMWMTTSQEFKDMLPFMLEKGFVLYRINDMVEFDENGIASPKEIYLPEGKKPLIISVDDVSYYDYMLEDGFANRMLVNDQGQVVTEVLQDDGTYIESYDGDVVPILDAFVKDNPEFSYRGAKGILAPTGYQGIWGYRITDLEDYDEDKQEWIKSNAINVTNKLRETGWEMASHSYTHNQYFRTGKITLDQLQSEIDRWKERVEPYIGQTNIFISPFGMHLEKGDPRFDLLVKEGFTIYCPVGRSMKTEYRERGMVQYRLNLDGYTMLKAPKNAEIFFPVDQVVDKTRPALK